MGVFPPPKIRIFTLASSSCACNSLPWFALSCMLLGALRAERSSLFIEQRAVMTHLCIHCLWLCTAYVPAPIYFGNVIDSACLWWSRRCESAGSCLVYDIVQFRYRYIGKCYSSFRFYFIFFWRGGICDVSPISGNRDCFLFGKQTLRKITETESLCVCVCVCVSVCVSVPCKRFLGNY